MITPQQHDAIIALGPRAEPQNGLTPAAAIFLRPWMRLGPPIATTGLGGLMDRRAELYAPREAYLDRYVRPAGLDAEAFLTIWGDLDQDVLDLAAAEKKKAAGGKGGSDG